MGCTGSKDERDSAATKPTAVSEVVVRAKFVWSAHAVEFDWEWRSVDSKFWRYFTCAFLLIFNPMIAGDRSSRPCFRWGPFVWAQIPGCIQAWKRARFRGIQRCQRRHSQKDGTVVCDQNCHENKIDGRGRSRTAWRNRCSPRTETRQHHSTLWRLWRKTILLSGNRKNGGWRTFRPHCTKEFLQWKRGTRHMQSPFRSASILPRAPSRPPWSKTRKSSAPSKFLCLWHASSTFPGLLHVDCYVSPVSGLHQSNDNDSNIKIADFGFAKKVKKPNSLTTQCGTPGYVAPEILEGKPYDTQADMWSLGVIVYILLGGYPPFIEQNQRDLFRKIRKGQYKFHEEYWGQVSMDAKTLIRNLLTVSPAERRTAKDVLTSDTWMKAGDDVLAEQDLGVNLAEFKRFNAKRKFKAAVKTVMATQKLTSLGLNFTKDLLDDWWSVW